METSNAASLASQRLLHGRLGQLAGQAYEQEVDRLAPRLLARELQVLEPATLQRSWGSPDPGYSTDLTNICRQAIEAGDISHEEDDELFRADLVIQGRKEGKPIYVVIEASVDAGAHDFDRADQRAAILSKAISGQDPTVHSLVISDSLQPELDTSNYRATHISLPFRREEYQAAIDAVDAAIQAAVSETGDATAH